MAQPRRSVARLSGTLAAVGLTAILTAGTASAHGAVGGGIETPIPLWLLYTGAGTTVAVTAGWLAIGDRRRTAVETDPFGRISGRSGHLLRLLGRSLGLLALAVVLVGGLVGPQVQSENVVTVLFWPVWLKGVSLVAIVAGSPWRVVSPWRTLYRGVARLEGGAPALVADYPVRLGHWPALLGYLCLVGVLENLTTVPRSPRLTATVVAGYTIVMLLGALAFGPTWFRRGDLFAVLYRLLGRVAPVDVARENGGYRLAVRPPWRGCTRPVVDRSVVAFAVAAVYTVSFDGLTNTLAFQDFLSRIGTGLDPTGVTVGLYVAGFAVFLASYALAIPLVDRFGDGTTGGTAAAFAATLLPIAAAYEVAHTYPYVLRNLGLLLELATGGVLAPALIAWLPVIAFWGSQILLIVGGHVVAVVAAHTVATERYGRAGGRRAHLPLVVIMVGYTVLSLWIISQPIVV